LGAGFSADAGLPLIGSFMNKMRDAVDWLEKQDDRKREIEAITNVLAFRRRAASAAYRVNLDLANIEELFSLASASEAKMTQDVIWAIAATLDFAEKNFESPQCLISTAYAGAQVPIPDRWKQMPNWDPRSYSCPAYELYLTIMTGHLTPPREEQRDTFITFNYDLVLEKTLRNLGIPFSYGLSGEFIDFDKSAEWMKVPDDQARAHVLKLHGSVNWVSLQGNERSWATAWTQMLNEHRTLEDAIRELRPSFTTTIFGDYESVNRAGRTPLLAPPTWQKSFGEPLLTVWDSAVAALQTATNVIIVGYSMPHTDEHFKYLLAAGLKENISLRKIFFVNLEADKLKKRLYSVFSREHLARYVVVPESVGVGPFLFYPEKRRGINSNRRGQLEYAQPSYLQDGHL